ncbi:MAG: hypothetical protein AAFX86_07995 [Pseudomonadota bacterium]
MLRLSIVFVVFPFLLLAGCATTTSSGGQSSPTTATAASTQTELPPQQLELGECGLFLWSLSGDPTFVFFSKATEGSAKMFIGSNVEALSQTGAGGDIFGQFMTEMEWISAGTGHRIDLQIVPGENMIEGQRVSNGRIKLTDAEGWETIIPVRGARACMNAPDGQLPTPS